MAKRTINVGGEIIELPDVRKSWVYLGIIGILGLWLLVSAVAVCISVMWPPST